MDTIDKPSITLSKYTQLNFIGDILEPHYNGDYDGTQGKAEVYIAKYKIRRNKRDIKLKFSNVNPTSAYSGDWYLPRKNALKYKTFINNGLQCVAVPWSEFKKLILINEEIRA